MNNTPNSERLHIGIYGRRNSGKSSLLNAITNQQVSVVSDVAGTTTDAVLKPMEVNGIGACVFIDTAGFDDDGALGNLRVENTKKAVQKTDIAILIFSSEEISLEIEWYNFFKENNICVIPVINKSDLFTYCGKLSEKINNQIGKTPIIISATKNVGIDLLLEEIARNVKSEYNAESITKSLVKEDDIVLLVTPIDSAAPKGRLILPQVQTIRDLLDNKCIVMCVTPDKLSMALENLKNPPKLIITDSQAFKQVAPLVPKQTKLTSFSILFAQYKGDLATFIKGAEYIDKLNNSSKILIAEACTHAPATEDIGRVKIPAMLRKKYGKGITVDVVSGTDFPTDLTGYDLVVHCGGCMFNKKYIMSRIQQCNNQNVNITNYGVLIAKLTGLLDKISF